MKKITLLTGLMISVYIAHGQGYRIKPEERNVVQAAPVKEAGKPQAVNDSVKVKKETVTGKEVLNKPGKLADIAPEQPSVTERKYRYAGTKYKPVPLVGDLKYYGNNHDKMLDYTKKYLSSRTRTFAAVQGRDKRGKIFDMMDKIFDKYEIPHEMKYLSVIESALNKHALSPVGAYGPWQFMPSTGQNMGLTVNARRDDRADWSRSTHAACKYMNYLYSMFGDWLLVVASYNSGPRPVINAMKKTGKSDYWSIKKHLPAETQNHVLAFVATATVFELIPQYATTGVPADFKWASLNNLSKSSADAIDDKPVNPLVQRFSKEELQKMTIIRIKNPIDLDLVSNYLEIDRAMLGRWNFDYLEYLEDYKPGGGKTYGLKIPKDKLDRFLEKKDYLERLSVKTMN